VEGKSGKRKMLFEFIKKIIHDKVSRGELDINRQIRNTVSAGYHYNYLDIERNERKLSMRFYYNDSVLLEKYKTQIINKKETIEPLKERQTKSKEFLNLFIKNNKEDRIIFPLDKNFELVDPTKMQYYAIIDTQRINYFISLYDNRTLAETILHLSRLQTETNSHTYYCFNFEDIYLDPGKYKIVDGLIIIRNW